MSRLLIVDDDDLALELYALLLEELPDIEYLKATNGTEALEVLEQTMPPQWPDCMMVDLNMPDMSGFELVGKLEKKYGTKKLPPIFILTNSVSQRDKEMAASYSAIHGFLSKPLSIESLLESLSQSN